MHFGRGHSGRCCEPPVISRDPGRHGYAGSVNRSLSDWQPRTSRELIWSVRHCPLPEEMTEMLNGASSHFRFQLVGHVARSWRAWEEKGSAKGTTVWEILGARGHTRHAPDHVTHGHLVRTGFWLATLGGARASSSKPPVFCRAASRSKIADCGSPIAFQ